jgi:hypothetical protein
MNWADAMKGNAAIVARDLDSIAGGNAREAASASWDPYDVWLTRVKQPRELAGHVPTARNSNRAWNRPG